MSALIAKVHRYQEIQQIILQEIDSGAIKAGEKLQAERQLAKRFECNFHTVRRALSELVNDGILERRVGSGTFVRAPGAKTVSETRPRREGVVRSARPRVCALFDPEAGSYYLWAVLAELRNQAEAMDVELVSRFARNHDRYEAIFPEGNNYDAIIFPWYSLDSDQENLLDFVKKCPCSVTLPSAPVGLEKNCFQNANLFGEGNWASMRMRCEYFRRLGYGNIALFGPENRYIFPFQLGMTEYIRYTNQHGFASNVGMISTGGLDEFERLFKTWSPYKGDLGVICYDDAYASHFVNACHYFNWHIPTDVGVLGYNNTPEATHTFPALSTMQAAFAFAATHMLKHALAAIKGQDGQTQDLSPQSFVIRESCGGKARVSEKELQEIVADIEANSENSTKKR